MPTQPPEAKPETPSLDLSATATSTTERGDVADERRLATHLRTLSLLAPGVAHDLRAPINAMTFNLEVMRQALDQAVVETSGSGLRNARLVRYTNILSEELNRLHSHLETLFAYLLPTPLRRETIPLSTVLREIETLVLPTARKRRISLRRVDPDDKVHLPGGPGSLREALLQVAVAALAEVASGGVLILSGEARTSGIVIRIEGDPRSAAIEPPGPLADPGLEVASAILGASGGTLRKMAISVSAEPRIAFEIEFPESRNPLTPVQA